MHEDAGGKDSETDLPYDLKRGMVVLCVRDADVVFEAASENVELKQYLFVDVEKAAPAQALLASNTSVIPITRGLATEGDEGQQQRECGIVGRTAPPERREQLVDRGV